MTAIRERVYVIVAGLLVGIVVALFAFGLNALLFADDAGAYGYTFQCRDGHYGAGPRNAWHALAWCLSDIGHPGRHHGGFWRWV